MTGLPDADRSPLSYPAHASHSSHPDEYRGCLSLVLAVPLTLLTLIGQVMVKTARSRTLAY
ncbi:hypothetical protein FNV65_12645 [Streptomyces sp. S1A1-8]|nr:hypothetical protein FNV67_13415 [Streptomyces sp. S1D4-20]QDN66333.1 hypothetical protein FNV66_13010 [Streptomyces sp. S1D4-14]QDN96988.1 hypothetical protein FNV58_14200 [Streptomyces sp. RLB1-9]QDO18694.1 hypothetical protein FNV65_12645 [Streptomyces sp. S1A1-8]QDO28822.1 hypothetical protein FNV63_12665 [Streptomyces sp. S1A1-3]QDO48741.1 hypothetical protein FNV60_11265 [Streptomyces sp. RLB3-5]QDO58981.1 hypothetical protein FNV59_13505 [Streptomyces sp. RLB1-8]